MIAYFVYFIVFIILTFVLFIAVKAITRGIEAKKNNTLNLHQEKNLKKNFFNFDHQEIESISNQIKELNKLYKEGVINDDEFKKAKEKILK